MKTITPSQEEIIKTLMDTGHIIDSYEIRDKDLYIWYIHSRNKTKQLRVVGSHGAIKGGAKFNKAWKLISSWRR